MAGKPPKDAGSSPSALRLLAAAGALYNECQTDRPPPPHRERAPQMNDDSWHDAIARRVVTAQFVVGALVSGCVMFLGVVLVVDFAPRPAPAGGNGPDVLTYASVFFALGALFARGVVQTMIASRGRETIVDGSFDASKLDRAQENLAPFLEATGDAGRLWLVFLSRTIVTAAIPEGAAFFCLVAYLLEGSWLSLGLAVLLILSVAVMFPTRRSVIRWIEHQLELVDEQRQFSQ